MGVKRKISFQMAHVFFFFSFLILSLSSRREREKRKNGKEEILSHKPNLGKGEILS
jgi:hypothetical protein